MIQPGRLKTIMIIIHASAVFFIALTLWGCDNDQHTILHNPEFEDWHEQIPRYVNLFPPKFPRENAITELDSIDFLKPSEKSPHNYQMVHNPKGDIDRAYGYDASDFSVTPDFNMLSNPQDNIQITWILHSSFLIQLGTRYQILLDPVLEPIDGLVGFLMQFREVFQLHASPPISTRMITALPRPAHQKRIVAVSHDHFDHLNWNTIEKLPADTHFFVPLGVEKGFSSGFQNVTAMDWYTHVSLEDLKITFLPAQHNSGRSYNSPDQTLWGGWLIDWRGRRIYFAGDTGYSDLFKDMRQRIGPMDI